MREPQFIDISLSHETLDLYYVRTSILKALKNASPHFNGRFLDIGCGQMPYRGIISSNGKVKEYIGLDLEVSAIHNTSVADMLWDGVTMPLADNSVDSAMATEVLEHCHNPAILLKEAFRVLKPGGHLFFTVPFLWPLHEAPYDEYRYTPFSLTKHFEAAGFEDIKIEALGGWDASLAQMIGLWVRRRYFTEKRRKWLSKIAKPVIKYLIKMDEPPKTFREATMITGLSGTIRKPL